MGKVIPFDPKRPFSNAKALERIQQLWIEGSYVPWQHAQDRMEQYGFDDQDVGYLILENGGVRGHRNADGLWRYTVVGISIDGRKMTAVFEIEGPLLSLVTVKG